MFIDVDTIEPGVDFAEAISRAVAACQVLVVIGPMWLTATERGAVGGWRATRPRPAGNGPPSPATPITPILGKAWALRDVAKALAAMSSA